MKNTKSVQSVDKNNIARTTRSMRPIPLPMRQEMAKDKFYHSCCLGKQFKEHCKGRVEWHHVWIYAGKQINEMWAIVPACSAHHSQAHLPHIKERFELISLNRATNEQLTKYNKRDFLKHKNFLTKKYGIF